MAARIAGAGPASRFTTSHNHEINVTPFVDVMLVLLIVFIIAAPLATNTLRLDLPRVDNGARTPPHLAIVSIDAAGRIYVTAGAQVDAPTDLDKLTAALSAAGPATATSVSVQADQRLRYGRFVAVLNRLQDDGYYKVNLITAPRAAGPTLSSGGRA
ncbi:MAG TPA: biopolymer transporter ExbD [Caulobacteraceae bacterium]|nr:biopolymer transporter ExbD [Caulobacteraceae bacterium]